MTRTRARKLNLLNSYLLSLLVSHTLVGTGCTRALDRDAKDAEHENSGKAESKSEGAAKDGNGPQPGSTETPSAPQTTGSQGSGEPLPSGEPGDNDTGASSEQPDGTDSGELPESSNAKCKDGAELSCQENEDGTAIEYPGGVPQGSCKAGKKTCKEGKWGKCVGAVGPAPADKCDVPGDDSNCDGVPNSGCACLDGETRPCGHNDIGECKMGIQSCEGGRWSDLCAGAIMPALEVCDGKNRDEDCNGFADIADQKCDCVDGDSEYCERKAGKGDCKWGQRSCIAGRWGGCLEWVRPEQEVCGARAPVSGVQWTGDEDCDGRIDASSFGKAGPRGCVAMMLDQDKDGYGKIGKDLSQMAEADDINTLGTACYCLSRPDIQQKYREGWVRTVNGRASTDCGDCKGMDGEVVYPGSASTTRTENRCLKSLRWTLAGSGRTGYFDLNCDGEHRDPTGPTIGALRCKTYKDPNRCEDVGAGRLVVRSSTGVQCGSTYEFGICETQYDMVPKLDEDGNEVGTEVVFTGCKPSPEEGGPGSHTVQCQ